MYLSFHVMVFEIDVHFVLVLIYSILFFLFFLGGGGELGGGVRENNFFLFN